MQTLGEMGPGPGSGPGSVGVQSSGGGGGNVHQGGGHAGHADESPFGGAFDGEAEYQSLDSVTAGHHGSFLHPEPPPEFYPQPAHNQSSYMKQQYGRGNL